MRVSELKEGEYAPYYNLYLSNVDDTYTLTEELEISVHSFIKFVQDIPMGKHDYRYAEGKWTIKDIIQHLIDAERVFAYRAMRFSRGDTTELPGYDENLFADNANGSNRSLQSLLTEMAALRHTTIMLFKSFTDAQLMQNGIASGHVVTVRALGFLIIAHQNHHMKIYRERYL
ncbi:DinB family protein [Flavobacterium sp. MK4S-17]|uniref:DinB family protein n=1 Tax=Flavobacterium sp. MK4S-17 TaxID=2543737 RepID=UPI00135C4C5B|nr:DinB family protein [Flavobacterium sp. MK4S-17]